MTDEELSLKIAEHLGMVKGPYPVAGKWRNVEDGTMTEMVIPNMVTDPAMRDLLQAELLEAGWRITIEKFDNVFSLYGMKVEGTAINGREITVRDVVRERLWAEAFAKAKGLL